jgi:hypothetical protein
MGIADLFADPEAEDEDVQEPPRPELKVKRTPQDDALREERYQKLIAMGVPPDRAEAGSVDGVAYVAARVYHRGT